MTDPQPKGPSGFEADLVAGIRAGDPMAEEEFVARYRRGIFAILRRSYEVSTVAEDLCQDTLRIAVETIRRGELLDSSRLSGFVCGIARNLALNYSRQAQRRETAGDERNLEAIPTAATQLEELLREEQVRTVRRVLAELPSDRDRELLLRFYIAEEEKESICKDLGVSSVHFNRILFRARERYRALYEKVRPKK